MEEPIKKCGEILKEIMLRSDVDPFKEPVPWREWGLDEYPRIIKQPMDLGTINRKYAAGEYKDIYEFAYDMRLVWRNCCTYNQEGSEIYALGKKLSEVFEEDFSKVEILIPEDQREPDIATKRSFVDMLFKLSPENLAKVVESLNSRCESALDKTNPEMVDIIVDAIDNATFHYLNKYVKECLEEKDNSMQVEQ